jgi:hypothetical protein
MNVLQTELPCGADLEALVEQIYDGTAPIDPEHQRTCPYCQEAIVSLRVALGELRALAGKSVRPPRGLSGRVLEQIRRERDVVVIADGPMGRDTVSELIVAQVARRAALTVRGVHLASCVARLAENGLVDLTLNVSAELGLSLPELAEEVRAVALAHAAALVAIRLGRIDVTVEDVD